MYWTGHAAPGPVRRERVLPLGKGMDTRGPWSRAVGYLAPCRVCPGKSQFSAGGKARAAGPEWMIWGDQEESGFPRRRMAALPANSETCLGLQTRSCPCGAITWGGAGWGPDSVVRGAASEAGCPKLIPVLSLTRLVSFLCLRFFACKGVGCHEQSPGCCEDGRSLFGTTSLRVSAGTSNTMSPVLLLLSAHPLPTSAPA